MLKLELSNEIVDPEAGFDQFPTDPRGGTAAYSDLYYYGRLLTVALERHTGKTDEYLSAAREQELATAIQEGISLQKRLDGLREEDPEQYAKELAQHEPAIIAGRDAEIELFECNLRWARFLAKASMNILPRKVQVPDDEEVDESAVRAIRGGRYIGTFADITQLRSPFADLKDRIQVANEGLWNAVRAYEPGGGKDGKSTRFTTFATWRIQAVLTKYAMVQEAPGWHIPRHIVEQIVRAHKDPAEMTSQIREWDAGRYTVPINDIEIPESDLEDEEESIELLSLADLAQDPYEDVEAEALAFDATKVIKGALDILAETSEREADIIALRFGISDEPDKYGSKPSLDDVAAIYGVTRERIRQIETKALGKLRKILGAMSVEGMMDGSTHPIADSHLSTKGEYIGHVRIGRAEANGGRDVQGPEVHLNIPDLESYRGSEVRSQKPNDRLRKLHEIQHQHQEPARNLPPISQQLSERREQPKESWQTYPYEPFDMQEALGQEASKQSLRNEEIARKFRDYLFHTAPDQFMDYLTKDLPTDYPILLVVAANRRFGKQLTAEHIEAFWNNHIETFIAQLDQTGNSHTLNVVSSYFARLLAERMTDESVIELNIPESLRGRLNFMGAFVTNGQLDIHGDVADFAGYKMGGIGKVYIHGSAGDFAGVHAGDYCLLRVDGNAGHFFGGQARGAAEVIALGSVGDYCGEGMTGEEAGIFVGKNAGDEIASEALRGTISIRGHAGTISRSRSSKVTILRPGNRDNGDKVRLAG